MGFSRRRPSRKSGSDVANLYPKSSSRAPSRNVDRYRVNKLLECRGLSPDSVQSRKVLAKWRKEEFINLVDQLDGIPEPQTAFGGFSNEEIIERCKHSNFDLSALARKQGYLHNKQRKVVDKVVRGIGGKIKLYSVGNLTAYLYCLRSMPKVSKVGVWRRKIKERNTDFNDRSGGKFHKDKTGTEGDDGAQGHSQFTLEEIMCSDAKGLPRQVSPIPEEAMAEVDEIAVLQSSVARSQFGNKCADAFPFTVTELVTDAQEQSSMDMTSNNKVDSIETVKTYPCKSVITLVTKEGKFLVTFNPGSTTEDSIAGENQITITPAPPEGTSEDPICIDD